MARRIANLCCEHLACQAAVARAISEALSPPHGHDWSTDPDRHDKAETEKS